MLYTKAMMVFSDRHKRERNEDRAFYLRYDGQPDLKSSMTIHAVLDGVSSSNGAQASKLAAAAMQQRLAELLGKAEDLIMLDDVTKREEIHLMLKSAICDADTCLRNNQHVGIEYGTTITLAVVFDEAVFTANIGDSPAYLLRMVNGAGVSEVISLFDCQNQAGEFVKEGRMSPDEALHSKARNMLLHMVGGGGILETEIATGFAWVSQSDILMLGSDGALAVLTEKELTELVSSKLPGGLAAITAGLFEAVQDRSTDNFTLLTHWLVTD